MSRRVSDVEDLRRENEALRQRNEQLVHQAADARKALEAFARREVDSVTVEASATPLLVHEAQERLRDEQRRAQTALIEAEERFRLVFDGAPVGMLMMNAGGRIALVNARIETLFGYTREELVGEPIEMLIPARFREHHPQYREAFFANPQSRAMGNGRDLSGLRKDGSEVAIEIGLSPIATSEGAFVLGSVVDISERKRAEAAQQQIVAVVESAADAIITRDLEGVIRSWNPGATRLLGYDADEMVGQAANGLVPDERREEESQVREQIAAGKEILPFETVRRKKDGTLVEVSITMSAIHGRTGSVVAASIIARDNTERNRAERERRQLVQQLRELNVDLEERVQVRTTELSKTLRERESLLREKTSLLKEIHHRVKNNLQVISSLLSLQARYLKDTAAREIFTDSQNRVLSIALVHEKLYQSADLSHVNFSEYVGALLDNLFNTYDATERGIRRVVEVGQIDLAIDVAIPCGLIVNELAINSLKHAFPQQRSGQIRVALEELSTGKLRLLVADDGVGMPAHLDPRHTTSLGLDLVFTFAEQLEAEVEVTREGGTAFRFEFLKAQH